MFSGYHNKITLTIQNKKYVYMFKSWHVLKFVFSIIAYSI